jgi:hypothetical protein
MLLLFVSGRRSNLDKFNLPGGYVYFLPVATEPDSRRQKENQWRYSVIILSENFFKNWENKEIQIKV